ncbi:hypothetical protein FACS1894199_03000 [Bacteroidia bacterium]|nr:hypothetical protein FACS1894199_03000 [Bacteroidia bacterium]
MENTEMEAIKRKVQELEQKIWELEQTASNLQNSKTQTLNEVFVPRENTVPKIAMPTVRSVPNKLYAANIIDGVFNKVTQNPTDYSVFELSLSSPHTATFSIYRTAYTRVLAAPEFLEGCDKQILADFPSNLAIEIGEAQYYNEIGKWKIIKKAKIKMI